MIILFDKLNSSVFFINILFERKMCLSYLSNICLIDKFDYLILILTVHINFPPLIFSLQKDFRRGSAALFGSNTLEILCFVNYTCN